MAKKLTGKTVNWTVVNRHGWINGIVSTFKSRTAARHFKNFLNVNNKQFAPFRIARIEVSK